MYESVKSSRFLTLPKASILAGLLVCTGSFHQVMAQPADSTATAGQVDFFEKRVRPVLVSHCYTCHSADTQPHGELRVDDRNGLLNGGDSGPAVVPGHPERSLLLQRINSTDPARRMPREGAPLTAVEIADLTVWIKDGAAWPTEQLPPYFGQPAPFYERLRSKHWARQPLLDPRVPEVANTAWPAGDIDKFILAKLEKEAGSCCGRRSDDPNPSTDLRPDRPPAVACGCGHVSER